ncbi:hypothetical protein K438DRAFT_1987196 [Mycena galopus ATCC 62051]|nr:hypothetical protein K438DRAFT_1987196 [Mycena galopus ATCC 62051]
MPATPFGRTYVARPQHFESSFGCTCAAAVHMSASNVPHSPARTLVPTHITPLAPTPAVRNLSTQANTSPAAGPHPYHAHSHTPTPRLPTRAACNVLAHAKA